MNIRSWRVRDYVKIVLGLCLTVICVNILFPRFHNDLSCEDSIPATPAQRTALADTRSKMSAFCPPARHCVFAIDVRDAQSFEIRSMVADSDFFRGCIFKDVNTDIFVYDVTGKIIRMEQMNPYE